LIDKAPLLRGVEDDSTDISCASQTVVVLVQLLPPELDEDLEQSTGSAIEPVVDGNIDVLFLLGHWILNFFKNRTFNSSFEVVK
jgi:hypothetical protein